MEAEERIRHYALPLETDVHITIRKNLEEARISRERERKEVNYVELIGRTAAGTAASQGDKNRQLSS